MARNTLPHISLIVPVYNEEQAISPFLTEAERVLSDTGCPYDILFIDDGSTDNTRSVIRSAKETIPVISMLVLSRNFGKEAALTAGLDHAVGDVVIPIDADLQDPPGIIAEFIRRWRAGADIVYGVRSSRPTDSKGKRFFARMFYRLFNRLSLVPIPADAGDFRLLDRRVVEEIKKLKERNRFMKGLMAWPGFRNDTVFFTRRARSAGHSRWHLGKLASFAMDGITGFSTVPLRLSLYSGAIISFLAFLYASWLILYVLIRGGDVPGYASLMVAIMFFGGVQLFAIGLVGEYVGRIFHEVKQRPIYVIDRIE